MEKLFGQPWTWHYEFESLNLRELSLSGSSLHSQGLWSKDRSQRQRRPFLGVRFGDSMYFRTGVFLCVCFLVVE